MTFHQGWVRTSSPACSSTASPLRSHLPNAERYSVAGWGSRPRNGMRFGTGRPGSVISGRSGSGTGSSSGTPLPPREARLPLRDDGRDRLDRDHSEAVLLEAGCPERLAHLATGLGQPERDPPLPQRVVELLQELRPREVDHRAGPQEEDRELHAFPPRVEELEETVPNVLDVEVEESGLAPEDEDTGDPLVLGVANDVREVVGPPHPAELRRPGPRAPLEEQHERQHDADEDAPQEARAEDAEDRGDGDAELSAA